MILASLGEIRFQVDGFMCRMGAIVFEAYRLSFTQKISSDEKYKMNPLVSLYYFAPCSACMTAAMGVLGEWRNIRWEGLGEVRLVGLGCKRSCGNGIGRFRGVFGEDYPLFYLLAAFED